MGQIFDELTRRNVIRVAIAYLVASWLVLQVADLVLENTNAPDWVMQVFMLLFALGFPLALIFSWAYELTPEGVKREKDVVRDQSVTRQTGRKLDQITIGLLLAVVVLVIADRAIAPSTNKTAGTGAEPLPTITEEITDKSIAVLAFEDLSEQGDQEYFADGLSEELLNVLAQVPDLKVAGRTSSFAFKGQSKDLREIGDVLNVAHILEGSVRKAGDRIRVTAQLINAETGFHLFSESYDRDLDDIFAVQDELATSIGLALQSQLIGTTAVVEVAPTEVAAFDLYLEARQKIHSREKEQMEEASALLDAAIKLDPDYVPALSQKALAIYLLSDASGAYGDVPVKEALAVARPLISRALQIDERYAEAYAVSGLMMDEEDRDLGSQIATLRRAIALNPNLDDARNWLSSALFADRQFDEARLLLEGIVERDPLYGPAFNNLIQGYVSAREFDKANSLIDRVERITGTTDNVNQSRGMVALNRGEIANAIRLYRPIYEKNPSATIVQFFYSVSLWSIGDYDTILTLPNPYSKVSVSIETGDYESARQELQQLLAIVDIEDALSDFIHFHNHSGNYADAATLVDEHYGDLDVLLETEPRFDELSLGYMPELAWTYLQLERDVEFEKVVAAMHRALDFKEAFSSVANPVVWSTVEFAAVTGDVEALLTDVRKLVEIDEVNVMPFGEPYFQQYFENEEFRRMNDLIVQRANDERAKLGMGPFRPIASTE